jgi:hypothetical protein
LDLQGKDSKLKEVDDGKTNKQLEDSATAVPIVNALAVDVGATEEGTNSLAILASAST